MIPSGDRGIALFMRNKLRADHREFSADKTVLFVHGATYCAESTFDLRLDGLSWMDSIAAHGHDTWLVDVRGYGRSTRPAAMQQPADANPPLVPPKEALRDLATAVGHIVTRRGIGRLNVIGWSWGSAIAARLAIDQPERVNKLVLHAPVWVSAPGRAPAAPTQAYRCVTVAAARERWFAGVPADRRADLVPPHWVNAWARAMLEDDPEAARADPPVLRVPNGPLADILGHWQRGTPLYAADRIRVPTLLIKAQWDVDTPSAMAQALFAALENVPYKSCIEIGEGTHTVMLEKNRMRLFRAVQSFLDDDLRADRQ